jgi:hypothetical protein
MGYAITQVLLKVPPSRAYHVARVERSDTGATRVAGERRVSARSRRATFAPPRSAILGPGFGGDERILNANEPQKHGHAAAR